MEIVRLAPWPFWQFSPNGLWRGDRWTSTRTGQFELEQLNKTDPTDTHKSVGERLTISQGQFGKHQAYYVRESRNGHGRGSCEDDSVSRERRPGHLWKVRKGRQKEVRVMLAEAQGTT